MIKTAPALGLGPLLRYVGETAATVWVQTDRGCQVEILGRRARTFEVAGHHYALVVIDGLRPGAEYEYQVALDGTVRWPEPRHDAEHGADALGDYALDLRETPHERWPDVMLMIGDQVYADDAGPVTRQFIRARRDVCEPPGDQVADFAEYCFLYREAWVRPRCAGCCRSSRTR